MLSWHHATALEPGVSARAYYGSLTLCDVREGRGKGAEGVPGAIGRGRCSATEPTYLPKVFALTCLNRKGLPSYEGLPVIWLGQ